MKKPLRPKSLMSDGDILAKFYMMHTTIGLSAARFGYIACGAPNVIRQIERGRKIHDRTRKAVIDTLLYLEAAHTEPIPPDIMARLERMGVRIPVDTVNEIGTNS